MNPRNNVRRRKRANKRMGRYRMGQLVYDFKEMTRILVEADTSYEEDGFGPTITTTFKLL